MRASKFPRFVSRLDVGGLAIANRVFLAPMSGVTDAPFRRLAARLGAGLVISEMTACAALAAGKRDAKLRMEAPRAGHHVVQLAGCEAKWMAEGARIAAAAGAAIIDINMGCPMRHVTTGWSGSALMRDLDHAAGLIAATVEASPVPVTLKMRLGWDERSINAPELAQRAEAAGVKLITVHGRTRCQFYKGRADWRAIRAVKERVAIPVVVNGDICSFADADVALNASGADAGMVGRGTQGQPWFPGHLAHYLATGERKPAPPIATQAAILVALYEAMLLHHGRDIGRRHARKHLAAAIEVAAECARVPAAVRSRLRSQVGCGPLRSPPRSRPRSSGGSTMPLRSLPRLPRTRQGRASAGGRRHERPAPIPERFRRGRAQRAAAAGDHGVGRRQDRR